MNGLSFYLKKLENEVKETQNKQKKENNKRAKINEVINRKTIVKINKTKNSFLRRLIKLIDLQQDWQREKTHIINISVILGNITKDSTNM